MREWTVLFLALALAVCQSTGCQSANNCANEACNSGCVAAGYPSGVCSLGACECLEPYDGGPRPDGSDDGDGASGGEEDDFGIHISAEVAVPGDPQNLVIAPDGRFAYLSDGNTLYVLSLTSRELVRQHPIIGDHGDLRDISPGGTLLAMTSFRGVSVVVLEGQSISERELLSGSNPAVYDAVFARSNVYATSFNARCVYSLATDGSSELEINPYPGGENVAGPELIERSSDEQAVYFTDELNEAIHKIDTTSDLVVGTFSTGYDLTSFCITSEGTRAVLAAGRATERLLIVDLTAPSAVPDLVNIKQGWFPWNTACNPADPDRILVLARHQLTGGYQPYEDLDFRKLFLFDLAEDSILGELTVPDTVNVLAVFPDFSGGLLLDTAGSVLFFEID